MTIGDRIRKRQEKVRELRRRVADDIAVDIVSFISGVNDQVAHEKQIIAIAEAVEDLL